MMGDTSVSEKRIQQQVRMKMTQPPSPSKKRMWHIPVLTSFATAVALLLILTTMNSPLLSSSNDGRGVPYDPLDDLYDIMALRGDDALSTKNYTLFESLPTIQTLEPLQYIDNEAFMLQEESFSTVIERKAHMYDEPVYEQGDIVRTQTYTGSHLPVYNEDYYEVIAVPGDRIYLRDGQLTVNGEKISSRLLKQYADNDIHIAGGYEQVLNAREYLLLNHFPADNSLQGATIIPVHKIYGEVVGIMPQTVAAEVQPTSAQQYFDALLYALEFNDGDGAAAFLQQGYTFPYASRTGEFFLEAGYRTVREEGDKAIIHYDFGREQGTTYTFMMYKTSDGWQLGPNS